MSGPDRPGVGKGAGDKSHHIMHTYLPTYLYNSYLCEVKIKKVLPDTTSLGIYTYIHIEVYICR